MLGKGGTRTREFELNLLVALLWFEIVTKQR